MHRFSTTISRRLVLKSLAALPLAAALQAPAFASSPADAVVVSLADLHSPYRQLPRILTAIRQAKAAAPEGGFAILVNGDVFERGNVVAVRSAGAVDWRFIEALVAEAPVVLNLGNHETALVDDMVEFVERAQGAGVTVIGNLVDARTGRFFAPVSTELELGGLKLALLGLAPTNPFVYREPVRKTLAFLDPVAFATQNHATLMANADVPIVMSHAGVTADRAILASLKGPVLVIGGHDHLRLDHAGDDATYFHGGSWGSEIRVVRIKGGETPTFEVETVAITPSIEPDATLQAAVEAELDAHLTEEDRTVITTRSAALDLPSSILVAVEAVRKATEADVAMLGHTTFGQGLPEGDLTQYDFDAFVRFGGDIRVVELPGERLSAILTRANQHDAATLDERTGDFVHANPLAIDPQGTYKLAVNGWTAQNQAAYLGTDDLAFEPVDGLELKATVRQALAQGA